MKPIKLSVSLLFLVAALGALALALLIAETWLHDFGTYWEWIAAGLGLRVLADIL